MDCGKFKRLWELFVCEYECGDGVCGNSGKLFPKLDFSECDNGYVDILKDYFDIRFDEYQLLMDIKEYLEYYKHMYLNTKTKSDKDFEEYMNDLGYYESDLYLYGYGFNEKELQLLENRDLINKDISDKLKDIFHRLNMIEAVYSECKSYNQYGYEIKRLDKDYEVAKENEVNKIKKILNEN